MATCLGCSCERAEASPCGGRVVMATRVSHTRAALLAALRDVGPVNEPAPGLLEIVTGDPASVVTAARRALSSVEAEEVRALVVDAGGGGDVIAAALTAPSLARASSRREHAHLLTLFDHEEVAFRSVYQPIVALDGAVATSSDSTAPTAASSRIVGYEALLRATGPEGQLMPDQLFGAAEQAGWLHVLDRIGRTSALRGAAGWLGEDELLFVNFLPTTIYRPQVCLATTERAAHQAGVDLRQVVFEVTESERVTDLEHLAEVFAYYRQQGCRVALDDLGAGYSSLNVLVRLQPDIVKLDKEIVQHLPGASSSAVVEAVVKIANAYGGQVLAECIETREQAEAARNLGVTLAQGWYFGRPQERVAEREGATARRYGSPERTTPQRALLISGDDAAVALPQVSPPSSRPSGEAAQNPPDAGQPQTPGRARLEELLARAVQASHVSITIADALDPGQPLIYANEAFEALTGYGSSDILGRNCRFLQVPGTDQQVLRDLRTAMAAGGEFVGVVQNRRRDGQLWWNELRISPVRDPEGTITHFFGFQNDVTARVTAEERLRHLAGHDQLTGLPNRDRLMRSLEDALKSAEQKGTQVAVLFVDLDGFKHVNDSLGHGAGDLALVATAARLRSALRESDVVARYSGDEFVVVLPGVPTHLAEVIARRTADALCDSFEGPMSLDVATVTISASVGLALYPEHGATGQQLIDAADQAMYVAKTLGGGRVNRAAKGAAGKPG